MAIDLVVNIAVKDLAVFEGYRLAYRPSDRVMVDGDAPA